MTLKFFCSMLEQTRSGYCAARIQRGLWADRDKQPKAVRAKETNQKRKQSMDAVQCHRICVSNPNLCWKTL
ncbi:hypothetical protein NPIL_396781 [Nephila pilipes]|uniref:Uncharacterized protein n=1 Tax=Nephila pilipes TaxID=299642 RepID=A0A8X6Q964_NEPPI|nr:hypothetical protein NPIL_396781 [Nephila pilipes]